METTSIHKYECQLYGEGKVHKASLFLQLKREGDSVPRYNVFEELGSLIKVNKEAYIAQNPDWNKTDEQEVV